MANLLLTMLWFFSSGIAAGQDTPGILGLSLLKVWPQFGQAVAWLMAIQGVLRLVAEALTRIAVQTENKWDNRLAAWVAEAVWFVGTVLGKFGYGEPKLVTQEKVATAVRGLMANNKPK